MALYKQKGSKVWWFEFNFAGTRIRQSAKTTSKKLAQDAEKVCRRQLEERYNGVTHRNRPKQFSIAAEEYLQVKSSKLAKSSLSIEEYNIRHLSTVFKGRLIADITASDVKRYQDKRVALGASRRTVNLDVGTLRAILKRNRLWENIKPDIAMLRDNSRHGMALSKEEENRLFEECRKSASRILYPAVVLTLSTGLRLTEVRLLTWAQIDLRKSELTVGKSKTDHGEGRIVVLNNRAIEVLNEWAEQFPQREPAHYLFPMEKASRNREGDRVIHHQDPTKPIGSWKKAWMSARARAGISPRFHDLRHTAVTNMLEGDVSMPLIGAFMGWSPSTLALMIKRYGHIRSQAFRSAANFLE